MLDKVLDKITETVGIVKFEDIITLKNVILIFITCIVKDDGKICPQIFLVEALYNE